MSGHALPAEGVPVAPTPSDDATHEPATPPAPPPLPDAAPGTSVPARRRRAVLAVVLRRLVGFAVAIALLMGGVALGYQAFLGAQPPPPVVGDPATEGVPTPGAVAELVQAITRDDADAVRAALPQAVFDLYAGELQRWSVATVTAVETLATYEDGPRSATALVLHGRTAERNPVAVHLIVLTQDGQIVSLR
jgi:hypothetical protein